MHLAQSLRNSTSLNTQGSQPRSDKTSWVSDITCCVRVQKRESLRSKINMPYKKERKPHTMILCDGKYYFPPFIPTWFENLWLLMWESSHISNSQSVGLQITSIYNLYFRSPWEILNTITKKPMTLNLVIGQPNEPVRSTQNTRYKPSISKGEYWKVLILSLLTPRGLGVNDYVGNLIWY